MQPLQGISSPIDRKHSRGLTTDLIEGVSTALHNLPLSPPAVARREAPPRETYVSGCARSRPTQIPRPRNQAESAQRRGGRRAAAAAVDSNLLICCAHFR
jgi:hypothetical protein